MYKITRLCLLLLCMSSSIKSQTTTTFTQATDITPATGTLSSPSNLTVSGMPNFITKVVVTLGGVSHDFKARRLTAFLKAPNGKSVIVFGRAGTDNPISNLTLIFDDASSNIPDLSITTNWTSGTYKSGYGASNYFSTAPYNAAPYCVNCDDLANPGVVPGHRALANLNNLNPNGTWTLYVGDEISGGLATVGSWSLTITSQATLPIDLISFTAKKQEKAVLLNWVTASELNNDHIELQKCADANQFETITTLKGAGTSTQKNFYTYLDKSPFDIKNQSASNIVYYRLKQVDTDGKWTYSNIISVVKSTTTKVIFYPNPTSDHIYIENISDIQGFSITDILGKTVMQGQYSPASALDISPLPSGYYFLNIQSDIFKFLKN
jgi:hypothetical protein